MYAPASPKQSCGSRLAPALARPISAVRSVYLPGVFAMGYSTQDIRNVALVGQAGAGKTLLLEALLLQAGIVRNKGSVQRGSTVSDFDPQEKRLQHSIDTALCSF